MLGLAGGAFLYHKSHAAWPTLAGAVTFFFLAWAYIAPANTDLLQRLRRLTEDRRRLFLVPAFFCVPFLVHAAGTGTLRLVTLGTFLAAVFVPTVLILSVPRGHPRIAWQDVLALAAVWVPFDDRWTAGLWWPSEAAYVCNSLVVTALLVLFFAGYRNLDRIGFSVLPNRSEWGIVGLGFLAVAAVCIPVGLWTGFIAWRGVPNAGTFLGVMFGAYFTIAVPEEVMFRGILQNLLGRTVHRIPAIAITALVFGLSHLNNGRPNWTYVVLATYAGVVYGLVYERTGSITAPALVHAFVDTAAKCFFDRG